jgi:hypothetical protein
VSNHTATVGAQEVYVTNFSFQTQLLQADQNAYLKFQNDQDVGFMLQTEV